MWDLNINLKDINQDDIVLDVDGVLLDFCGGFLNTAQKRLNREIVSINGSYSLKERFGLSDIEHKLTWDAMHEYGMSELPLLPGADVAFNRIKNSGKNIHLVTGIWEKNKEDRLHNLNMFNMIPDSIVCVGTGTDRKDVEVLKIKPLAIVDDRLQHLNDSLFVPIRCWINCNDDQFGLTEKHVTFKTDNILTWVDKSGLFPEIGYEVSKTKKFGNR